jgi:hypothetical protein
VYTTQARQQRNADQQGTNIGAKSSQTVHEVSPSGFKN